MSIYPAKNKKGDFTGSWTVEVMLKGKRTRATAPDFEAAKQIERALEAGLGVPETLVTAQASKRQATVKAEEAYTLARLEKAAGARHLGQKDEALSLKRLATMVEILGPETPVESVRYADLEKASAALSARGLAPKTINRYLAAISGALKWAVRNEVISRVPPKPWRPEGKGRVSYVPAHEDHRIIAWLLDRYPLEVSLAYEVLVSTGLRINELLTLEPHEIDADWVYLSNTKNGDARDVPITPQLAERLRAALRRKSLPKYDAIFDAFVAASEALALGVRVTPHVLRHTAATRLNALGVPTATIQQFLGHRDIRTTLKYTHADKGALREASLRLVGAKSQGNTGTNDNGFFKETSGLTDLQSAPFAARDTPPSHPASPFGVTGLARLSRRTA